MHRFVFVAAAVGALSADQARADTPQESFDRTCATCHDKDGKGNTKMGKKFGIIDLSSAAVQAKFTDEAAIKQVTEGGGEKWMPAFKNKLSPEEIPPLVAYARVLAAPAASPPADAGPAAPKK